MRQRYQYMWAADNRLPDDEAVRHNVCRPQSWHSAYSVCGKEIPSKNLFVSPDTPLCEECSTKTKEHLHGLDRRRQS